MAQHSQTSDNETPVNPKKRSRKSLGDDDGASSKKRGRPRVDTEDATAANRRRTQIRLAQRAYRQRKETTISSLKRRVGDLESTVTSMNQNFLKFNEAAINSGIFGLRPELARELQSTAELLSKLAADAANSANYGDDEEGDVEEAVSETIEPKSNTTIAKLAPPPPPPPPPARPAFMQNEQDHLDMSFGYTNMFQGRAHQMDQRDAMSSFLSTLPDEPSQFNHNPQEMLPFGLVPANQPHYDHTPQNLSFQQFNIEQINQVSVPTTPLKTHPTPHDLNPANPVGAPFTYSFQETTFARRLQRHAIERGFHLLSYSHVRPDRYKAVFKLSLLLATREQIMARSRSILTRGVVDDLEFWGSPFIHLGGAGTHYPRRDPSGKIIPIQNGWNVRRIGPLPNRVMLEDQHGRPVQDLELDMREFEGEWFDPHDVQGYLEEKGCIIDPQKPFADALIDVYEAPDPRNHCSPLALDLGVAFPRESNTLSMIQGRPRGTSPFSSVDGSGGPLSLVSSSGSTTLLETAPRTPLPVDETGKTGVEANLSSFNYADMGPAFDHGFSGAGGFEQDHGDAIGGFFDTNLSIKPGQKKRIVTVDVQVLVDELVNRCRCLGRSPGFRRTDVDNAFAASIMAAH